MRFTIAFIALVAPFLASAVPIRRDASANDILVLQFADVLEQLESQFYKQALDKFKDSDFQDAGFASSQLPLEQFKVIQFDEDTHSTALRSALKSFGKDPIDTCKFNFDPALTDVSTMAATARVVENVGVGAYLGGAALIDDVVILEAAGSILTVEARHQTVLNILSGASAVPSPFDIPLTPSEVLALAGPFISGCDLGIPANTPLVITNTGTVAPGTKLEFEAASINGTISEDKLFCQMILGGAAVSIPLPFKDCVVPNDINGPVAIWITSDGQPLVNNVRDRATTQQVAGPAMAFIDTVTEELGKLAKPCEVKDSGSREGKGKGKGKGSRKGSGSHDGSDDGSDSKDDGSDDKGSDGGSSDPAQAQGSSSSTTVISLDQASSIVASASSTTPAAAPTVTIAGAAASPSSAQSNVASAPGGPNMQTGKSADGSITIVGWTNIPAADSAPAAAPAAPAAPASGGYGGYGGY